MIFLDDFIFSLQSIGGISVYWLELLKKFDLDSNQSINLLKRSNHKSIIYSSFIWKKNIKYEYKIPIKVARFLPILNKLPSKSLFHSSYLRLSWQKDVCNIITIHDLAAELKMISGWRRFLKQKLQEMAIRKADGIICVSDSTKESLLKHYKHLNPNKIKTIYHGCSNEFFQLEEIESLELDKTILFIGSRSFYKNFEICIEVLKQQTNFRLLLVGGGDLSIKEIYTLDNKLGNRYDFIKEVTTQELNKIYNKAFCLLYPTFYEGFGFPVVEAMKSGCPVIGTNIPAIAEIGGESIMLVDDPKQTDQYNDAILSLLNEKTRNHYIKKGLERALKFTWEKHFDETKRFYNNIYMQKFGINLFNDF